MEGLGRSRALRNLAGLLKYHNKSEIIVLSLKKTVVSAQIQPSSGPHAQELLEHLMNGELRVDEKDLQDASDAEILFVPLVFVHSAYS